MDTPFEFNNKQYTVNTKTLYEWHFGQAANNFIPLMYLINNPEIIINHETEFKKFLFTTELDKQNSTGYTALMIACEINKYNMENIISIIINAGANLNIQSNICKHTALIIACYLNKSNIVRLLVNAGADLNA